MTTTPAVRATAYAVALALLTALLTLASLLTPAVTPSADAAGTQDLRIGTYNIIASTSPSTFGAAVRAVAPSVHVLGLQEVNSKDKEAQMRLSGWSVFRKQPSSQEPVMWRSDRFSLQRTRMPKISGRHYIGNERPSAGKWRPAKHVTVVRLKDRWTNQRVSIVNVHLVAGAVRSGVCRKDSPRLCELYKKQVRNLLAEVRKEKRWGKTYVLGDFNISFRPDRKHRKRPLVFASFKRHDMRSMWATQQPATGTRDTGLVDQVYNTSKAAAVSILTNVTYSDHHPAVATYQLARR